MANNILLQSVIEFESSVRAVRDLYVANWLNDKLTDERLADIISQYMANRFKTRLLGIRREIM